MGEGEELVSGDKGGGLTPRFTFFFFCCFPATASFFTLRSFIIAYLDTLAALRLPLKRIKVVFK